MDVGMTYPGLQDAAVRRAAAKAAFYPHAEAGAQPTALREGFFPLSA
jgi:hypothetical protein